LSAASFGVAGRTGGSRKNRLSSAFMKKVREKVNGESRLPVASLINVTEGATISRYVDT